MRLTNFLYYNYLFSLLHAIKQRDEKGTNSLERDLGDERKGYHIT